jgi:hypothetical protein
MAGRWPGPIVARPWTAGCQGATGICRAPSAPTGQRIGCGPRTRSAATRPGAWSPRTGDPGAVRDRSTTMVVARTAVSRWKAVARTVRRPPGRGPPSPTDSRVWADRSTGCDHANRHRNRSLRRRCHRNALFRPPRAPRLPQLRLPCACSGDKLQRRDNCPPGRDARRWGQYATKPRG